MYISLIQNAALLLALTAIYGLLTRVRKGREVLTEILAGLLFGGVAVAGMLMPFKFASGIIYDGRSIVIAMAGLFGGWGTAAVSMVVAGSYRAYLGGPGLWAGLATIISCAMVGLAFRRAYGNQPERLSILSLYGFGIIVHIVMLACQLLLIPWPTGLAVISRIWQPILLIFPFASMLMGLFLGQEEHRIQTERKLSASESLLHETQQISKIGGWDYDVEKKRLTWTDEVFRIHELPPSYDPNSIQSDIQFFAPDARKTIETAFYNAVERGDPYDLTLPFITAKGNNLWVRTMGKAELRDGKPVRIVGNIMDITERKRAEEETRWRTALLEAQINATIDGILIVDEKGNKVVQNQRCVDLWKIPQHIVDNHDDKEQVEFVMNRAKDPQKFVEKVMYLYTHPNETSQEELEFKDGTVLDRYSAPVIGKDGTYFGRIWVFRDITERKQAEGALYKSELRLRAVLDATPFPIALVDLQDNNIEFWSRSALTLFGHTATTARGWYEIAYPDPDYRRDVIDRWKPVLEKARLSTQAVNAGEYRVTCRDGSVRICELYAAFLAEDLIVTFNDITERKKAEEELQLSEERYRSVVENIGIGISLISPNMEILLLINK